MSKQKHSRNKKWCEDYATRGMRERNKMEKVFRHWKRLTNKARRRGWDECPDGQATAWLKTHNMFKRMEEHSRG